MKRQYLLASLTPFLILLLLTILACVLGYAVTEIIGEPSALRKLIIRITQTLLVLSIFPAMAFLKLTKAELGLTHAKHFLKQISQGFVLGLITLLPVFILFYVLGISIFDKTQPWTVGLALKKILLHLLLALLIGVVEELVFRGMLLAGLRKKLPVLGAILVSSIYFAALHFLDSKTDIPEQEFNLLSSFDLLRQAYANIFDAKNLSAFLSLLMVGIFLAVIKTRAKKGLGLCIGCHAGWVWQMKMNGSLFNTDYSSSYLYLVSNYNFVLGPLVTSWLALALVGYFVYRSRQASKLRGIR